MALIDEDQQDAIKDLFHEYTDFMIDMIRRNHAAPGGPICDPRGASEASAGFSVKEKAGLFLISHPAMTATCPPCNKPLQFA